MHQILLDHLLDSVILKIQDLGGIQVLLWQILVHLPDEFEVVFQIVAEESRHETNGFMCVNFGEQRSEGEYLRLEQIELIPVVSVFILAAKSLLQLEMRGHYPLESILHLDCHEGLCCVRLEQKLEAFRVRFLLLVEFELE
jgi:hypothetical protein